ncbi:hypothetical protein JM946_17070 [Steroidobacter sp. S1-65]|uniref:Uncharacterized protein n=1 Tax=Steroidobacter gossypii TaxID=2805490 RepID=A0ABS1WZP1_9GAMM|nr:hypothetical protein [Steroidobacter gossypii]MBM0106445.1 hypothetical protein [Steroidobacter gossypii]
MRFRMCVRDVLVSCMLAAGFVIQAHAEEQQAAEAAPASPPSQSASSATPATETTSAVTSEENEAERGRRESAEFERIAKQYRKTEKDGQTLYCRNEKTLGSRLAKPVCLTDTQLRARIRAAEETRTQMSRTGSGCRPGEC